MSVLLSVPTTNPGKQHKATGLCSMSKTMCPHTFGHPPFYHLSFSFIQLPHFLSSSILLCLPPFLYPLVCITSFTPRALQVDPFPKEEEEKLKTAQKSLKSPVTGRSLRRRRGEEDEMEEVSLWRKDRRKGRERKTKPGSRRLQTIRALFDLS